MGAGLACCRQQNIVIAALAVMLSQTRVCSTLQQLIGGWCATETEETKR